jgi:glycosyltransferase involved in cell wall biosynthesis
MKESLISCIVPVFNGELYIAEALESILSQTYRPLQIIVADDGSSDGTAAVVARYGTQVHYLSQSNSGAAAARNLGLSASLGDFVAFLDADDLWHAEKLERQMACFVARPELDGCVTYIQNFWIPELAEEAQRYRNHPLSRPVPGYHSETLLARRLIFETVGPFNPELRHADKTEWFLRAGEKGAVIELLPDILVYRRFHEGNASRSLGDAIREEYLRLLKATLDSRRQKEST